MGDEDQGPWTNPRRGMADVSTNETHGRSLGRAIGGSHWTIGREEMGRIGFPRTFRKERICAH